ncbi:MAG: response regulator transcription factor [Bacteroidales bacterium]|jgi:two-component system alkaline phosphatase synthesis response regulator PhoP|nr:response regulator transcription factor [Bacteroidales bacterium]MDI9575459.1 response regulator transcription factor [Bacteroidota bacterium]MDD3756160.1 response regulator transcription factor [Bacteroidales bacterium]MDY0401415.1 response regulator transcription factor [Bacteroidales bacterium]HHW59242.1 response regulator transcription factor [Bacteroidales bacterium]
MQILIVDDEKDIIEFLSYNLTKDGYKVLKASSGMKALEIVDKHKPEIIVLDIMMPEMDGIETCRQIRELIKNYHPYIIFLTARNEDFTQIAALEAGGDDFIAKPIKPRVFISKIHSIERRLNNDKELTNEITIRNITINPERFEVIKDDMPNILPRKEFELLYELAKRPGRVYTRDELLDKVWGNDIIVGERTIDVHISKLREKLGADLIQTIKGVGYKINP